MAISLFDPIKLGAIEAPNRIIMAPLTRGRAGPGFVPNELAREYYRQRASAGLIISEATGISQEGLGWPSAPGLWTDAQVEGWKPVTEAVHEAGGRIVQVQRSGLVTAGKGWTMSTWVETERGLEEDSVLVMDGSHRKSRHSLCHSLRSWFCR